MKFYKTAIQILSILFLLSIPLEMYAQRYLIPNEGELLLIRDKGNLNFSITSQLDGLFTSQIGYSPFPNVSVVSSFTSAGFSRRRFDTSIGRYSSVRTNGHQVNTAIGTYYKFNFKKKKKPIENNSIGNFYKNNSVKKGFLVDFYAGYSIGEISNSFEKDVSIYFKTNKIYAQGGVHYLFKFLTFSYTFRVVRLDYNDGLVLGAINEIDYLDVQSINFNNPYIFYGSSFRYQIGLKQARIFGSVSRKINSDRIRPNHNTLPLVTFGIICELDKIFKGKKIAANEN